ncbi:hypothetical protein [Actinomyces procaprae]|uniref:hypothetical protein n=1 Tax=Actinomyces procaprae TaxID=2560010 RepID=UPI00109DB4BA|nr:hypothetical protein [Actinomyces procaprae]
MMATTLDALVAALADLRRRVDRAPSYRWGTVTSASPLRVRLDGDSAPLGASPVSLVAAPAVGARVLVLLHGRRAVVLGTPAT